jgi:spermidine synthase
MSQVIDMGKKYFKDIAEAWADPRVTLVCGDANVYINECKSEFDVIVSDTSDPDGPARPLFEKPFYQKCKNALRAGGILVTQAENVWLNLELIGTLRANALSIFDDVEYGHFCAVRSTRPICRRERRMVCVRVYVCVYVCC